MRPGRTQLHIHNNGWTDGHNFGAKNTNHKEVSRLKISTQYNVEKSEREIASSQFQQGRLFIPINISLISRPDYVR